MARKSSNPRIFQNTVNMIHVILAVISVFLFLFSFVIPGEFMKGFPLVFLVAAVLNYLTVYLRLREGRRKKGRKAQAFLLFLIGCFFLAAGIVSGICIWFA
ncbi:MAG: hypothetical protein PUB22_09320 [Clostridiales bacterium]|nr:hypothetical protein [Clostridiales bacterium]